MERVNFLDSFIDNVSREEILDRVDGFIDSGKVHQLVAVNAAKMVRMSEDERLSGLINSCSLIFADGQAVVWASRFLGRPLKERVAGVDLMQAIIEQASKKGHKVYFLGAREEVVRKIVCIYKKRFSDICITGWHNGYFKSEEERAVIEEIKVLRPDILFVAMGSPDKEYWINRNLSYLGVPVCMGVGGSFDVIAGFTSRAPKWMQDIGLEWFFRFMNEPRRLWKRYLFTNLKFVLSVLKERLIFQEYRKKRSADVRNKAV